MTTSRSEAVPRYVAGIDGGGSGTRARLQDIGGRTLGVGSAGASGLGQGVEQAWRHVSQALAATFAAAGLPLPPPADIALGLGLAGAGVPAQRAAFLQAAPGYALCVLENDGLTQLLGAFAGGPGVVVAAGTGSVAMAGQADGSRRQAGGWGFPVGDEGSGAWLGLHAVRHAQAVLDGLAGAGALSRAIFDAVGADAPALLAWCARANAHANAHAWAQLAPLVFAAAEVGDAQADALLQAAADHLARLVAALQAGQGALPVVVRGSIGERLAPRWPAALRAQRVDPAGDSADGALQLVRAALRT